ncbi:MAG: Na+/H+ antiporter NhaC family protein [Lachnospiraceae bacterium]|nr:Na+/H+ antiporter NhaC family protein [Lachnospiraceae bacterium]
MIIAALTTNSDTVKNTFWALVPPIVAIGLALITKEVYSSLFVGVVVGGLLYAGFNFQGMITHVYSEGIVAVLSDPYNVGILVFLVVLGIIVSLMNRAGGSAAFGKWALKKIKGRKGAQISTIGLGILIFIDDYFNCLTVGSVMRPITDSHKVSRSKLSYLIDATAAPVCIIAPISSWAAAVSGFVPGEESGISLFVSTIPYNLYALLTILFMFMVVALKADYGSMLRHELNAIKNGDLYTTEDRDYDENEEEISSKGGISDMLVPIFALIGCCVVGMLWSGGLFEGSDFITAFSASDASVGLGVGSIFALLITLGYYMARRVISFKEFMDCVPKGFASMIPPILILTFAWSIKAMTDSLGAKEFVASIISGSASGLVNFLPVIIFIIAVCLAFATGTSWGTFGILIPIVVASFQETDPNLMIIAMSACMAGAVCGDHCSPISDTTIMASAGAKCNHINHVNTQMPYVMTVAVISAIGYIILGFTRSIWISLPVCAAITIVFLLIMRNRNKKRYPELF